MITIAIRDFILEVAEYDNEFAIEMLKKAESETSDKKLTTYCEEIRSHLESRPISEGRSDVLSMPLRRGTNRNNDELSVSNEIP